MAVSAVLTEMPFVALLLVTGIQQNYFLFQIAIGFRFQANQTLRFS